MTTDTGRPRLFRRRQGGPPLSLLAIISVALLIASLAAGAALGGVFPSPFTDDATIRAYILNQSDALHASSVLLFGSSVPLAIYAATVGARLRQLGVIAPGHMIATIGGALSAAALSLSALFEWTLSRPAVRVDAPLTRALQDLAFLTGGVMHVVFLGLLIAGIAVPALVLNLFGRTLALVGLAIALVAELSTLVMAWSDLGPLLPIARFPGLIWLIVVGFLLPLRRHPANAGVGAESGPARVTR